MIIDGRILKHNGELTALDAEEVIAKATESFVAAANAPAGLFWHRHRVRNKSKHEL